LIKRRPDEGAERAFSLPSAFLAGALGAVALIYTLVRAAVLSLTHDESLTYLHYVLEPLDVTLDSSGFSPANNHLLNSLLMRAGAGLFGASELALRFQSWLGHVLYVSGALLLVRRLREPSIAFGTFILLVANPFMLDFFSLARGYGLGLGFTLMGLHALLGFFEQPEPRTRRALLAFALLGCAVLANFSFLNVYLAAAAVFFIQVWRTMAAWHRIRVIGAVAALSALLIHWAASTLLRLKEWGELYYGGETGFFADTVQSLVRSSLYGQPWTEALVLPLSVLALVSFAASAFVLWRGSWKDGALVAAITAVAALGIVLQHHLLGVRFVIDRAALFFLPLFCFTLGAAVDRTLATFSARGLRGARIALGTSFGAVVLVLLAHASICANLTHTFSWKYDADTARMIDDLAAWKEAREPGTARARSLGVHWLYEPSVNFYIKSREVSWLEPVNREGVASGDYDYYFYPPQEGDLLAGRRLVRITKYPVSGNILAARRGKRGKGGRVLP
jgi:hypothetical protein